MVGAILGAITVAFALGMATTLAALPFVDDEGCRRISCSPFMQSIMIGFYGFQFGWLAGTGLGCWGLLRVLRLPHAELTGALAVALQFLLGLVATAVSVAIVVVLLIVPNNRTLNVLVLLFALAIPFAVVIVTPAAARFLALNLSSSSAAILVAHAPGSPASESKRS